MDNKTLMAVIVTALIVAVLTSLITVKLSGNIISVPTVYPSPTNYTSVYTKAEVDSLLKKIFLNTNITIDTLKSGPVGSLQSTVLLNAGNIDFKQNYTEFNKLFNTHISPGGFEQKTDFTRSGTRKIINLLGGEILAKSNGGILSPGGEFFTLENSTLITPEGIFFSVYNSKDPSQNYRYNLTSPHSSR